MDVWSCWGVKMAKRQDYTSGPSNENRVVDYQCNSCQVPQPSRTWSFLDYCWCVLAKLGRFGGQGGTLWSGNLLLSPKLPPCLWYFNENRVVDDQCNSCWDPRQSKRVKFLSYFWRFLVGSGGFCGQGASLWFVNHNLSPNNLTRDHLMKIGLLVAGLKASGCHSQYRK